MMQVIFESVRENLIAMKICPYFCVIKCKKNNCAPFCKIKTKINMLLISAWWNANPSLKSERNSKYNT